LWYFLAQMRKMSYICAIKLTKMSNNWQPTASEEREARQYLKLRVACTDSYLAHCTEYVREAIRSIVAICYKYREPVSVRTFSFSQNALMRSEIDGIVRLLIEQLESSVDDLLELAVEDDDTDLLMWLDTRNPDWNVKQGFEFYERQWEAEVEAQITGTMYLDYSEDESESCILASMEHPYDSDWWKVAAAMAGAETISSILRDGGVSYGVGHTNVGITMLRQFGQRQIEAGFGHARLEAKKDAGAKYFRSVVRDYTACIDCVSHDAEGWRPIDECPEEMEWHYNCRCSFYFK